MGHSVVLSGWQPEIRSSDGSCPRVSFSNMAGNFGGSGMGVRVRESGGQGVRGGGQRCLEEWLVLSLAWWCRSVVLGICNAEAGGSQIQGQPGIHSVFKASLDNKMRLYLKIKKKKSKKRLEL